MLRNRNIFGYPGPKGDSAYTVAVGNGFVGSKDEWLESLRGPQGISGTGATVRQTTGISTTEVMSQNAITNLYTQASNQETIVFNDVSASYLGNRILPNGGVTVDSNGTVYALSTLGTGYSAMFAWDKNGKNIWCHGYFPLSHVQYNDMLISIALLNGYLFHAGNKGQYFTKTSTIDGTRVAFLDGGATVKYKNIEVIGNYLYVVINDSIAGTWTLARYDSDFNTTLSVLLPCEIFTSSVIGASLYLGGFGRGLKYDASLNLVTTYTTTGLGNVIMCPTFIEPIYKQVCFASGGKMYYFVEATGVYRSFGTLPVNIANPCYYQHYGDNIWIISASGAIINGTGGSGSPSTFFIGSFINSYRSLVGKPTRYGNYLYIPTDAGLYKIYSKITT